ncbi:hypothetical protein [Undibacterium aquatile]|uniref:Uncharacterized protein n=1 Tax=Undibacterium aquatile TaxID=1537398 RepID=A0ABR6XCU3_9BURK|nr:hypothetical protein [Undibacterium aquatile]MBC3810518.1 hypothetical protein [Undibacterium aquatile]
MPRLSFNATFADGTDANSELRNFAEYIGLESVTSDRYSFLLLLQLFDAAKSGHLNPAKVVSQIRVLEGLEANNGLKAPTPFNRPALKGLWHQHYLEDGMESFAKNFLKGLDKFGLPYFNQKIVEAEFAGEERYVTEADIPHIVNDAVSSNWERLVETESLTGEWLIFAKYESRNYYLCIGKHKSGDDYLRSQIDAVCLKEFPFLQSILNV